VIRLNLQTTVSEQFKASWYFASVTVIFSVVCYLLFKVLRRPQLFDGMNEYEQSLAQAPDVDEQEIAGKVFSSIEQTIRNEELYRKPRLSVNDISNTTGLSVKDISWAINKACQQNFCEFINVLRVRAVQRQISINGTGNSSLLDIAFDSGFNSKSTFNATFKKVVGLTPSQFVRQRSQN
jgi:AraC-like DNA-binding protein